MKKIKELLINWSGVIICITLVLLMYTIFFLDGKVGFIIAFILLGIFTYMFGLLLEKSEFKGTELEAQKKP